LRFRHTACTKRQKPFHSIQPTQPQSLICKPPRGLRSRHLSLHADQQSIIGVSKSLRALPALLRRGCSTLQRVESTSGDSPGGRRHRRRGRLHPATARPSMHVQPGTLVRPQGLTSVLQSRQTTRAIRARPQPRLTAMHHGEARVASTQAQQQHPPSSAFNQSTRHRLGPDSPRVGVHPDIPPHTKQVRLELGRRRVTARRSLLDQVLGGRQPHKKLLTLGHWAPNHSSRHPAGAVGAVACQRSQPAIWPHCKAPPAIRSLLVPVQAQGQTDQDAGGSCHRDIATSHSGCCTKPSTCSATLLTAASLESKAHRKPGTACYHYCNPARLTVRRPAWCYWC
jgi:hypothetical protein